MFQPRSARDARSPEGLPVSDQVNSCEVSPDGTCLVVTGDSRIREFSPDGRFVKSFPILDAGYRDVRVGHATRGLNGSLLVYAHYSVFECSWGFPGGCEWRSRSGTLRLDESGRLDHVSDWLIRFLGLPEPELHETPSEHWRWLSADVSGWTWPDGGRRSQPFIRRELAPPAVSHVGFDRSGLSTTNALVRLQIPRAGSTAAAGRVRGKVYEAGKGRWVEVLDSGFELPFPVGMGSATLELKLSSADAGTPLREYLVRLESAEGVELSPWTDCRLWLFDVGRHSVEGELRMATPSAPDTPDTLWILAHWPTLDSSDWPDWAQSLQVKDTLGSGEWQHLFHKVTEPATQAIPIHSGSGPANRFFRIAR